MLPEDRSAMPGVIPATRKYAARDVAIEQLVEGLLVEVRAGAEPRGSGVIHQDIHPSDLFDQGPHRRKVVEVGGHERARPPSASIS